MNMFSFFLMALIPVEIFFSNMYQNRSLSRYSVPKVATEFAVLLRKTPVLASLLNKAAALQVQHRYFPEKFAKFLRTPILKNIFERLLL